MFGDNYSFLTSLGGTYLRGNFSLWVMCCLFPYVLDWSRVVLFSLKYPRARFWKALGCILGFDLSF